MSANTRCTRTAQRRRKELPAKGPHPTSATGRGRRPRPTESQALTGGQPVLDERVTTLVLDVISSLGAAIASASTRMPYAEARQALASNQDEKYEFTRAVMEVVEKHHAFFEHNRGVIELSVVWASVHASHYDNLFAGVDRTTEDRACSPREALFFAAVVLAPLLILAVISILQNTRRV